MQHHYEYITEENFNRDQIPHVVYDDVYGGYQKSNTHQNSNSDRHYNKENYDGYLAPLMYKPNIPDVYNNPERPMKVSLKRKKELSIANTTMTIQVHNYNL